MALNVQMLIFKNVVHIIADRQWYLILYLCMELQLKIVEKLTTVPLRYMVKILRLSVFLVIFYLTVLFICFDI